MVGAEVNTEDKLFATLDPTLRGVDLPSGRRIIVSDTVGFVSQLPTMLVAAFRATLEEVLEADIVVHVRDISHPDSEAQRDDVHAVLRELGLGRAVDEGLIEALNKTDLLVPEERRRIANRCLRDAGRVPISALTGDGCGALLELLDARFGAQRRILDLDVALDDGETLAWLYSHGEVLSRTDDEGGVHLKVGLDPADVARFERRRNHLPA